MKLQDQSQPYNLDDTDKEILSILQQDPDISYADLGSKVGKAPSSVHNRVKKMIDAGVIKKQTYVRPFKVGLNTIALIGLSVDPNRMNEIAEKIATLKRVQMVGTTTGDHDIVFRVVVKNDKALWRFINEKIKTIPGVSNKMDVSSFIDFFKMEHSINFEDL